MSKGNSKSANSSPEALEILWKEGFFKAWHNFKDVCEELGKRGNNFSKPELAKALKSADFLTRRGSQGSYQYAQRIPAINKETEKIESELFSAKLITRLGDKFSEEIADLRWNFGKSGTCSAFLLRKILEKLIFLTFAKNGLENKLKNYQGRFVGLEDMINLASSEKIGGLPFLMPQTARNIKGMKYLGDIAAHDPLTNVDPKTINPQMPFIITAYEELSQKL